MLELGMHNLQTHSLRVHFTWSQIRKVVKQSDRTKKDAAHSSQINKVIGEEGILLERLRSTPPAYESYATVKLVSWFIQGTIGSSARENERSVRRTSFTFGSKKLRRARSRPSAAITRCSIDS